MLFVKRFLINFRYRQSFEEESPGLLCTCLLSISPVEFKAYEEGILSVLFSDISLAPRAEPGPQLNEFINEVDM